MNHNIKKLDRSWWRLVLWALYTNVVVGSNAPSVTKVGMEGDFATMMHKHIALIKVWKDQSANPPLWHQIDNKRLRSDLFSERLAGVECPENRDSRRTVTARSGTGTGRPVIAERSFDSWLFLWQELRQHFTELVICRTKTVHRRAFAEKFEDFVNLAIRWKINSVKWDPYLEAQQLAIVCYRSCGLE